MQGAGRTILSLGVSLGGLHVADIDVNDVLPVEGQDVVITRANVFVCGTEGAIRLC